MRKKKRLNLAALCQRQTFHGLQSYREKWLHGLVLLEVDKQRLTGLEGRICRTGNLGGSNKDFKTI